MKKEILTIKWPPDYGQLSKLVVFIIFTVQIKPTDRKHFIDLQTQGNQLRVLTPETTPYQLLAFHYSGWSLKEKIKNFLCSYMHYQHFLCIKLCHSCINIRHFILGARCFY